MMPHVALIHRKRRLLTFAGLVEIVSIFVQSDPHRKIRKLASSMTILAPSFKNPSTKRRRGRKQNLPRHRVAEMTLL